MSDVDRSATTFNVRTKVEDRDIKQFADSLDRLNRVAGNLEGTLNKAGRGSQNFARQQRVAAREVNRFGNTMRHGFGALAAFNTYTSAASGILSGAFVFALSSAGVNLVKLGAQAESTRERFLALSESVEDGRRRFQEFADFADERGLQFRGLAEAANQLRVVGFAGEDLDELIRQIGITAGDSTERVERITRALGQMRAFGRVALEELNQLTEAGIPIITAIANELDIPEGRVRGLIELGKIDFQTVRNAFADLASESSAFFAASEAQAETLSASFNRLSNAIFFFADELNERTSPSLKALVEGAADIIDFFTTFEGQVVGLTTLVFPAFLVAVGSTLIVFGKLIRSTDPFVLRFRRIAVHMQVAQVGANRLRSAMILLRASMRAALFTPLGLVLTAIGTVAIPTIISRLERLREEARELEEALLSLERAGPGSINRTDDPDLYSVAIQRLGEIERRLENLTPIATQYFDAWKALNDRIDEVGEATRKQTNDLAFLDEQVSEFSKTIEDLTIEDREIRIKLGLIPPPGVTDDSDIFGVTIATNKLEAELLSRFQEAQDILATTIQFTPEQEEEALRTYVRFIRKLQAEVIEANRAGLEFNPGGTTITTFNRALAEAETRLEAFREAVKDANAPIAQLEKVLDSNTMALIRLQASADVGIITSAEQARQVIEANRNTLRDLLVLQQVFAQTPGVTEDVLERLANAIDDFKRRLFVEPIELENDLFGVLFGEDSGPENIRERLDSVFTDTERFLFGRVRELVNNISHIRGVGSDAGLVDIFVPEDVDESIRMQRQIRQETYNALLEDQEVFNRESRDQGFEYIHIVYNQAQAEEEVNRERIRAAVRFTDLLGQNISDQVEARRIAGDIEEEEAFRLHNAIGEARQEIEEEVKQTNDALERGFRFRVPPQVTAFANAILTIGEAAVSAGATFENALTNITDQTRTLQQLILQGSIDAAAIISLIEQPFLATSDAIASVSSRYREFLAFLSLTQDEREALLSLYPEEEANRIRNFISDIEEIYARIGTGFDADAIRALPTEIRRILEDAFRIYRQIPPTMQQIQDEITAIFETANLTLAERVRRAGRFIVNNLTETGIQLGTSLLNIFRFLTGDLDAATTSFGILTEIVGGLGEVLGVGRERTINFVNGLDLLIRTGESSLILQERITQSLEASTIGAIIGLTNLDFVARDSNDALTRMVVTGHRYNDAYREVNFVTGESVDRIEAVGDAARISSLDIDDAASALLGLASAGGSLTGLIAPGVGLLADSLNNVLNSAADYVAALRAIDRLPGWFSQGDVDILQRGVQELDRYTTALREARSQLDLGLDVELPSLEGFAAETQEVINTLVGLRPFFEGGFFDDFLQRQGFPDLFPEEDLTRGQQLFRVFEAVATGTLDTLNLTEDQAKAVADAFKLVVDAVNLVPDALEQVFNSTVTVARSVIGTINTLSETIGHNARIEVEEMRRLLDETRRMRREEERKLDDELDRDLDILRQKLEADLISLTDYYNEVDAARTSAEMERQRQATEEIKLLNEIQEKEYEARLNQFNLNKAARIADIVINAAVAFTTAIAQLGPLGVAVGATLSALALTQIALVSAQQAPPKPPPITALATGGVVDRPTRALIGEAGPEAVIPLDKYDYSRRDSRGDTIVINQTINGSVIEERKLGEAADRAIRLAQRRRRVPARA